MEGDKLITYWDDCGKCGEKCSRDGSFDCPARVKPWCALVPSAKVFTISAQLHLWVTSSLLVFSFHFSLSHFLLIYNLSWPAPAGSERLRLSTHSASENQMQSVRSVHSHTHSNRIGSHRYSETHANTVVVGSSWIDCSFLTEADEGLPGGRWAARSTAGLGQIRMQWH